MKPAIAIVCYTDINRYGNMSHILPLAYSEAIETAGGIPYILPFTKRLDLLPEMLEPAKGALFTGGIDVAPSLYREDRKTCCGATDRQLDAYQLQAFRVAINKNLPVLAICRGAQLVNVALGGTLYQDIFSELPGPLHKHAGEDLTLGDDHQVTITAGSLLHTLFGDTVLTNSRHHQAIKKPADCLRVTASSSDGIIEALEHTELPVNLVQWHPEMMTSDKDSPMLPLFLAFTRQCIEKSTIKQST